LATILADRKKRLTLKLPLEVRADDALGRPFVELTHCMNVSGGGILFESQEKLLVGTRLRLRIDIPTALRKHFENRSVWETGAVIMRLEALEGQSTVRVGARFVEDLRS
jgi:hypothetical protein